MHQDPREPNHLKRQYDADYDDAMKLRQEEQHLERSRKQSIFLWLVNSIYLLVGLLEILLGLRFFLRISGANPDNLVARFIYNLSAPFVAPFSTLFISPTAGGGVNIFDVNLLIAIVIYALLGWLAIWVTRYFFGR